jgi:hypothetical protein
MEAQRSTELDPEQRASVRGEAWIWWILVFNGLLSILLTLSRATAHFAPFVYSTLPISIGLFTWRYDWGGRRAGAAKDGS